jgi:hypothetical protein
MYHITSVPGPNETINNLVTATNPPSINTIFKFNGSTQLDYFPTNIFKVFPWISAVFMDNCYLPNLVSDSFNYCNELSRIQTLYLTFKHLPAGFARTCTKLYWIELYYGQLETTEHIHDNSSGD